METNTVLTPNQQVVMERANAILENENPGWATLAKQEAQIGIKDYITREKPGSMKGIKEEILYEKSRLTHEGKALQKQRKQTEGHNSPEINYLLSANLGKKNRMKGQLAAHQATEELHEPYNPLRPHD